MTVGLNSWRHELNSIDLPHIALHRQLTPALEEARTLTRTIQDMELELAMLRNSRPEEERMTIEEANQYLDDQVRSICS